MSVIAKARVTALSASPFFRALVVGALVFGALACGSPNGSSSTSTGGPGQTISTDDFCGAYCGRVNTCDATQAEQTCVNECKNANAALLPKLNSAVTSQLETCIAAKDCKTVLSSSILKTCQKEVVASVAPSADGAAFCNQLAAADTKCGKTLDKANCLEDIKLYNDTAIRDAEACTSAACSAIDDCVDAALGDDLKSSSGSTSSGTTGGSSGGSGGGSTGSTDAGAAPDTGSSGGKTCQQAITTGSVACDACLAAQCCQEDNACGNSTDCVSEIACVSGCASGDNTCVSSCRSAHPTGDTYLVAWATCDQSHCSGSCP
jgi:uncharacterized membrane protein YgcG